MDSFNRRTFLRTAALAGGSFAATDFAHAEDAVTGHYGPRVRFVPAKLTWAPPPPQAPATDSVAVLPGGARLWYWDTGGTGDAIVLLHAGSGSGTFWEYQQPALARAGYRVIGYSTRGHFQSEPADPNNPGTGSGDLHELVQYLGIDRFHLIGTAAGGGIALDYAISHQQRLLSLVVANSLGSIQEPDYGRILQRLLPGPFFQTPVDFRELGPSYRAGYFPGVDHWLELHAAAGSGTQPNANRVSWAALESLHVPTLFITGNADLYMPPWLQLEIARHVSRSEVTIFGEVGHSTYWEQPESFNRELLRFMRRNRERRD